MGPKPLFPIRSDRAGVASPGFGRRNKDGTKHRSPLNQGFGVLKLLGSCCAEAERQGRRPQEESWGASVPSVWRGRKFISLTSGEPRSSLGEGCPRELPLIKCHGMCLWEKELEARQAAVLGPVPPKLVAFETGLHCIYVPNKSFQLFIMLVGYNRSSHK